MNENELPKGFFTTLDHLERCARAQGVPYERDGNRLVIHGPIFFGEIEGGRRHETPTEADRPGER